jgi:hypothetical protein
MAEAVARGLTSDALFPLGVSRNFVNRVLAGSLRHPLTDAARLLIAMEQRCNPGEVPTLDATVDGTAFRLVYTSDDDAKDRAIAERDAIIAALYRHLVAEGRTNQGTPLPPPRRTPNFKPSRKHERTASSSHN